MGERENEGAIERLRERQREREREIKTKREAQLAGRNSSIQVDL